MTTSAPTSGWVTVCTMAKWLVSGVLSAMASENWTTTVLLFVEAALTTFGRVESGGGGGGGGGTGWVPVNVVEL